jgi:hypothetical protein
LIYGLRDGLLRELNIRVANQEEAGPARERAIASLSSK